MLKSFYKLGAVATLVALSTPAFAEEGGSNFGTLAENITTSLSDLPGLLSALCYLFGIVLVILGIIKIKEHVEKPDNTPVKEGVIRLMIGGALFALPIFLDIVRETIDGGDGDTDVSSATLQQVQFNVGGE